MSDTFNDFVITPKLLYKNRCYTSPKALIPKGIVLHSCGFDAKSPDTLFRIWNTHKASASVHYVVKENKVTRFLPDNYRAWGSGGSINGTHIQIELIETPGIKYHRGRIVNYNAVEHEEYFNSTLKTTLFLCLYLKNLWKFAISDIIDHAEAHRIGKASNHRDITHWTKLHGVDMDDIRTILSV